MAPDAAQDRVRHDGPNWPAPVATGSNLAVLALTLAGLSGLYTKGHSD